MKIQPILVSNSSASGTTTQSILIPQKCVIKRVTYTIQMTVSGAGESYTIAELGPWALQTMVAGASTNPRNWSACQIGDEDTLTIVNAYRMCTNFVDFLDIEVSANTRLYLVVTVANATGYVDARLDLAKS